MTPQDRLKRFIAYKGLTISAFERTCGLGNGFVSKVGDSIRREKLELISKAFPELNLDWVINEKGEMLADCVHKAHPAVLPDPKAKIEDANADTDYFSLVPLINIDSVGGMHSHNALTNSEQYTERLIPFTGAKPGDRAIYQSGDSMSPTIPPGSIMQIRKVDDWQEYFGYGNTFVLWLRDDRRITKQILKYKPDPQNYVTCHSFNPDSADEELPKKMIREVWKVIKVLTDKGW